jgi:hypothetical protein
MSSLYDCRKIQKILIDKYNYELSLTEIESIWQEYSDMMCASWIMLPDSEDELNQEIESVFGKFL